MSEREYIPLWQKCIEEVGGYEEAKRQVEDALQNYPLVLFNVGAMQSHLLEYRRHHNIFEVGDRAVLLNWDNNDQLLTVEKVHEHKIYDEGGDHCNTSFVYLVKEWAWEQWFNKFQIRHATPKEIAQGYRDE